MKRQASYYGAWLLPDGSVVQVEEVFGHDKVLRRLLNAPKSMKDDEVRRQGMRQGFIRVVYHPFAIEMRSATPLQKSRLMDMVIETSDRVIEIEVKLRHQQFDRVEDINEIEDRIRAAGKLPVRSTNMDNIRVAQELTAIVRVLVAEEAEPDVVDELMAKADKMGIPRAIAIGLVKVLMEHKEKQDKAKKAGLVTANLLSFGLAMKALDTSLTSLGPPGRGGFLDKLVGGAWELVGDIENDFFPAAQKKVSEMKTGIGKAIDKLSAALPKAVESLKSKMNKKAPAKPAEKGEKEEGKKPSGDWFKDMSKSEQEKYLKEHPKSEMAAARELMVVAKLLTAYPGDKIRVKIPGLAAALAQDSADGTSGRIPIETGKQVSKVIDSGMKSHGFAGRYHSGGNYGSYFWEKSGVKYRIRDDSLADADILILAEFLPPPRW